jgi:hypothetical protein
MDNEKIFEDTTYTETLLEMLMNCIGSIMTKEEKFTVKDETREELVEFVESMSSDQFEKLTDFVNKIPTITQQAEFKCSSCGHHNDIKLKGMDDFF